MAHEVTVGFSAQDALEVITVCMDADNCPVRMFSNLLCFLHIPKL